MSHGIFSATGEQRLDAATWRFTGHVDLPCLSVITPFMEPSPRHGTADFARKVAGSPNASRSAATIVS